MDVNSFWDEEAVHHEYCKGYGNSLRSATVASPTRSSPLPKELQRSGQAQQLPGGGLLHGILEDQARQATASMLKAAFGGAAVEGEDQEPQTGWQQLRRRLDSTQQQQQQQLTLSHGLHAGGKPEAAVSGGPEGLLGLEDSKRIFNVASLLVHFMTTSLHTHTKWGKKARLVHNTLDQDEVLPEALAVANPAPPPPPSPAPAPASAPANTGAAQVPGSTTSVVSRTASKGAQENPSYQDLTMLVLPPEPRGRISASQHEQQRRPSPPIPGSDDGQGHAHAHVHIQGTEQHPPDAQPQQPAGAPSKLELPASPKSPTHSSALSTPKASDLGSAVKLPGQKNPSALLKHAANPGPRIEAQQRDAAVVVLALEWPVSLTTHQVNRSRVVEASSVTNPSTLYRWHMVRQLVRFMGRKRVALRTRWLHIVNTAMIAAAQACRDAEVQAWKELGIAVQVTRNNKVLRNESSVTSQHRLSNSAALDRSSAMSSSDGVSVSQGSVLAPGSEMRRSRTNKVQTMACQRPHQEPVLLSDKWNGPTATHSLARINTTKGGGGGGGKPHAMASQYAHLSASQRPGGTAAEQAKAVSMRRANSTATPRGSAARAGTVGSSGDSGNLSQAAKAKATPQKIGAAYDLRRRNRPVSPSGLHVDVEPSSPTQEASSEANSPVASMARTRSSNSGRLSHSNVSSRYLQSSPSNRALPSNASSGRGAQASTASSRGGVQSPASSRNLQSSATSKPPIPSTGRPQQQATATSKPSTPNSRTLRTSASLTAKPASITRNSSSRV